MSATNRGAIRKPQDFYATPVNVVENLLDNLKIEWGGCSSILEPSAGNGNIIQALRNKDIRSHITAVEIREEEHNNLKNISDKVLIYNFLEWKTDEKFDLIIGNPPYTYAREFIEKGLNMLNENGKLIMLLRTAFLESKSRYNFWQCNPVNGLYVLSKRPSFTGKGSDATSYSWFIWDKVSNKQEIKVI